VRSRNRSKDKINARDYDASLDQAARQIYMPKTMTTTMAAHAEIRGTPRNFTAATTTTNPRSAAIGDSREEKQIAISLK